MLSLSRRALCPEWAKIQMVLKEMEFDTGRISTRARRQERFEGAGRGSAEDEDATAAESNNVNLCQRTQMPEIVD